MAFATLAALSMLQTRTVLIDVLRQKPISPYIYGVNFPDWEKMKIKFPLVRQGGNRMTAYNWETNASNAGNDYKHQNDGYMGESNEPGWTVKNFMDPAGKNGAAILLTLQMAGYVSADKKGDGDVNQTPNYLETRFHKSLPKKPGPFVFPPDTTDKFVYQDEFLAWVEKNKPKNSPVWFCLDNESDLWHSTHARIWPVQPTYRQIADINVQYAEAVKRVMPKALTFGPVSYGWQGFRTFQNATDANRRDFLDFYMNEMRAAEGRFGRRLLDVLDVHWYPEAKGEGVRVAFGEDKPGTPAARIQAPRSLWDPTYVEDSWIAEGLGRKPIVLIPNLFKQIDTHYPGTKLAFSEYDFGGGATISGAIAQADVLGIFGRQGVYAATQWGMEVEDIGQLSGFRAFLDYDGKGSRFGDLGLFVAGPKHSEESVYAAADSRDRRRVTIVAINKTQYVKPFVFGMNGYTPKFAKGFVVGEANVEKSIPLKASIGQDGVRATLPPYSVATFEVMN